MVGNGKKPRFIAVDFFCGAGGTTRGLIDAGGYVIAGIDHDGRCKRTYEDNNKNRWFDGEKARFLNYDIFEKTDDYPDGQQEEIFDRLNDLIPQYRKKGAPLLFAVCAPCQPFTSLSSDKKMSGNRIEKRTRDRDLLLQSIEFIKEFKPEAVLSENVAGISDSRYGDIWENFENDLDNLDDLGYEVKKGTVCVSKFGVAQKRKRSILLAVRRKPFGKTDFEVLESDTKAETMTVEKAIGSLPALKAGEHDESIPNHRVAGLREKNIIRMKHAKPGESNEYMDEVENLSLPCHQRANAKSKSRCFSDVYTRMHPDRPSPTITTKCHSISNGRYGHYDTKQLRAISMREAAALQSFPDDYVFYPTDKIVPVAHMIGNAVPPKLAKFFAEYLIERIKPF